MDPKPDVTRIEMPDWYLDVERLAAAIIVIAMAEPDKEYSTLNAHRWGAVTVMADEIRRIIGRQATALTLAAAKEPRDDKA